MVSPTSSLGTQSEGRTYLQITSATVDKSTDYTILASDRTKLIRFTGAGPWAATMDTSATLGSQFVVFIRNDSAVDMQIDTTTGNINGGAAVTLEPGLAVMVNCNGTDCFSFGVNLNSVPLIGGTMTGPLILSADPVTALGAATKQYVDAAGSGIAVQPLCYAATTANLNATYANGALGVGATLTNAGAMAAFSVDGVSPALNSRILVKDQTLSQNNGCYTLTTVGSGAVNWILTRATDYDTAAEIQPGTLFMITNGTINAVTSWVETNVIAVVGTDPIAFAQFTFSPGAYANTALSNLAATAVNADILPGVDTAIDLGNPTHRYGVLWSENIATGTSDGDSTALSAYDTNLMSNTLFIGLVAGNPPECAMSGDITSVTQAVNTNNTKIATTAFVVAQIADDAANKALSNLAGVAVNTTLVSDTDITDNLGTQAIRWNNIYAATLQTGDTATDTLRIGAWDVDGASFTPFITLTANNTPSCALASSVTGVTQAANDNSTKLATTAYVDAAAGGGSGALVYVAGVTAVASANVDFGGNITGTYDNYMHVLNNVSPSTNDVALLMRVGTGGGPTYQATNYGVTLQGVTMNTSPNSQGTYEGAFSATSAKISGTEPFGGGYSTQINNGANCVLSATVELYNTQSANFKNMTSRASYITGAGTTYPCVMFGGAIWRGTTALTSTRFFMSSGNTSGQFRLYAIKNS